MPIKRATTVSGQPSPERQSVLSFVSPSVADLLFYETVDAKTVGAGSGKVIDSATWADTDLNADQVKVGAVEGGVHSDGYTVTVNTATSHGFVSGNIVTVVGLSDLNWSVDGAHKVSVTDSDTFTFFVRQVPKTLSGTFSPLSTARVYKNHPSYGAAHPDADAFPRHKLCHVKQADTEGLFFEYYYAADRLHQDDYNFEFSQADLGGNKYDTVVRTYVTLRSEFSDTDVKYEAGDRMPDVPASQFEDTYLLMTRHQKRIGDVELDGLFVVEQRIYFKRVEISIADHDDTTKGVLIQTETLYYRGEIYNKGAAIEVEILDKTKWGVSLEGVQTEAKQLSEDWFLVTSTDVIPQDKTVIGAKFGGKVLRSYDTYITYSWPAVLGDDGSLNNLNHFTKTTGIEIMDWEDKGGTFRNYVRPMFEEQGYRGPTRATIVEEWSLEAPVISSDAQRPFVMRPLPIVYNSPYLTVQIPPTLHGNVTLVCNTGTSDPTWGQNVGSDRHFPETNVTKWPDSFVATVEVNPFRGGYLTRQVTVYKPEPIVARP